jgi:hypothetical protein
MPKRGILLAAIAMLSGIGAVSAQEGPRLAIERLGDIQTGLYSTSTGVTFSLDPYAGNYLLHIAGEREIFVLHVDHGALGGRLLKFDSGGVALQVSGWGAVTVYTDAQPGGLPAERTADSTAPALPPLTLADMQKAAGDEVEHLSYTRDLHLTFDTDWPALAGDAALRALTFDAMQNVARGIERFTASQPARAAFATRINAVHLGSGSRQTISLIGRTLIVTFVPSQGFAGRASSHAIAHVLGELFGIATQG